MRDAQKTAIIDMQSRTKEKIYSFMKTHKLGVLATVTTNVLPEAAVVGIYTRENLEVLFATYDESRKVHNLKYNPRVALVVGWEGGKTIQYEGRAVELTGDELKKVKREEFADMPSLAKYINDYEQKFYKLEPIWIKYSDLSVEPWNRMELKFS